MMKQALHPLALGADMTADSAHKTLPVLTGGSLLNISKTAPAELGRDAKQALLLFGSTSPSYLIMESMDRLLPYLEEQKKLLDETGDNDFETAARKVSGLRDKLAGQGWEIYGDEPLKLTIKVPENGERLAAELRNCDIECEFADRDFLVMMWSPANDDEDYERVSHAFAEVRNEFVTGDAASDSGLPAYSLPEVKFRYSDILFSDYEEIEVSEALGRVSMEAAAKCPPAILPIVPGEVINEDVIKILNFYGIKTIRVRI